MKPSIRTFGEILYSPSQYVVPVFQRNYRWTEPQWAKLWDNLMEIQGPEKGGNHFMGFLVFVPGLPQPGQHNTFHLIDGQQRLATLSILLAALRNVSRQSGHVELAKEIHDFYLVHPLKKEDSHYRILPKDRDRDSYLALVSERIEPIGRMADALGYFEEQLSLHAEQEPEKLRDAFNAICQRFEFMCATLETENAYNIFKSLNSTGVPLDQSDLIRNFMFMHLPPDEHDKFDHELWKPLEDRFARPDRTLDENRFSGFFRDFMMADGRYVRPQETFTSFEARYEATGFSPKALASDLTESGLHYAVISGQRQDADDQVTNALAGLNQLESSTTYPLLLTLFRRRASGAITSAQVAQCVRMLRGFILRRFICGESSRGYGRMFVRALGKETQDPAEALEAYLLDRGWPDDHKFESAFVVFPLYQRGYTREVLETLERARGHKEPANLQSAQVEHVLPRTLSDAWVEMLGPDAGRIHNEWLHRPGNLTLSAYNQELWNHSFDKKRERYAQSNIVITRELADYSRWTAMEIRARGIKLALEAAGIWLGPKEPLQRPPLSDGDEGPDRAELRHRFWSGLSDYIAEEFPGLPNFEVRPSWTTRMPSGLRHVGIELRFGLRQRNVGIDIWFWRGASLPVWEQVRQASEDYDRLVAGRWWFEQVKDQQRARMSINQEGEVRSEFVWPQLYHWLGEKLSLIYEQVIPKLREEMERSNSEFIL